MEGYKFCEMLLHGPISFGHEYNSTFLFFLGGAEEYRHIIPRDYVYTCMLDVEKNTK